MTGKKLRISAIYWFITVHIERIIYYKSIRVGLWDFRIGGFLCVPEDLFIIKVGNERLKQQTCSLQEREKV